MCLDELNLYKEWEQMDIGLILVLFFGGLGGCIMVSLGMAGQQIQTSKYPQAWSPGLSEEDKKMAEQREKEHRRKKTGLRLVGALSSPDTGTRGAVSFPNAEAGAVSVVPLPEKEHS